MSTPAKTTKKAAAVAAPVAVAVAAPVAAAAAAAPVAAPKKAKATAAAAPAAAAPAAAAPADDKKTRVQYSAVIGTAVAPARCGQHLRHLMSDSETEDKIAELRQQLKTAAEADKAALKEQVAALAKNTVRLSSGTSVAAAVILDAVVKELLCHALDQAKSGGSKGNVEVAHLHSGAVSELALYPLYSTLKAYSGYNPAAEEELKAIRAAENKAAKAAREAKKKALAAGEPVEEAAEAEAGDEGDAEHGTKSSFGTYVDGAIKTIRSESEAYAGVRVSSRVRESLTEILAECVARVATLSRILVEKVVGVRTMSVEHIEAVVNMLLVDAGRSEEAIQALMTQIADKLKLYKDHQAAEKAKKVDEQTDEQKAAIAAKKAEAETARKQKQIEQAKLRAQQAADKVAALTA